MKAGKWLEYLKIAFLREPNRPLSHIKTIIGVLLLENHFHGRTKLQYLRNKARKRLKTYRFGKYHPLATIRHQVVIARSGVCRSTGGGKF